MNAEATTECPYCRELVKVGATACPRCQRSIPLPPRPGSRRQNLLIGAGIVAALFGAMYVEGRDRDKSEAAAAAAEQAETAKAAIDKADRDQKQAARTAENRRMGFHCLSGWDGSNESVVEQIKDTLRDPSSFEHEETRIAPIAADSGGKHPLFMSYRARNGFGGMNAGHVVAVVDPQNCQATIVTNVVE